MKYLEVPEGPVEDWTSEQKSLYLQDSATYMEDLQKKLDALEWAKNFMNNYERKNGKNRR